MFNRKNPTYKATIFCSYKDIDPIYTNLTNLDIEKIIKQNKNYNLIVITKETEKTGVVPIITIYDVNKWIKETTPNKQTRLTSNHRNIITLSGDPINLTCNTKEELIKTTTITSNILLNKQSVKKLKKIK